MKYPCSTHSSAEAVVYCTQCKTHQTACSLCITKSGRHFRHPFVLLEDGVCAHKASTDEVVTTVQDKKEKAINFYKASRLFDKNVKTALLQPLRDLDDAIDEMIKNLENVRVDIHTAALRAAQTVRTRMKGGADIRQLVHTVLSSAKWIEDVRKSLNNISELTLSEFVDQTPQLHETSTKLQEAMKVTHADFNEVTVEASINTRIDGEVEKLRKRTGSFLQLSNDIVAIKPSAQRSFKTPLLLAVSKNGTYAFDPAIDTWCSAAPMSFQRSAGASTLWNGKVVVAGGQQDSKTVNFVEQYDPGTNSWTTLPSMLNCRQNFLLVTLEGSLLAIGGMDGAVTLDSTEIYDSETKQWKYASKVNTGRCYHFGTVLEDTVIIAGGALTNKPSTTEKSCESFNLLTKQWEIVAPLVEARYSACSASYNGKVYVFGGCNNRGIKLDSVEELININHRFCKEEWTTLSVRLSVPRVYLSSAVVRDKVYILGGLSQDGKTSHVVDCFDVGQMKMTCVAQVPESGYFWSNSVDVSSDAYDRLFKRSIELEFFEDGQVWKLPA